jgi:riboflavin kinase/FMN adenylyltransferase
MMQVTELSEAQFRERNIAVGEFDGVHLGHRAVIAGCDSVLTFEPHPRAVVGPTGAPPLLTTLPQKIDALSSIGVEELVIARFDEDFSQMEADDFISDVLIERLGAREVSVGQNFRFGRKAKGDAELLLSDSRFVARIIEIVESDHGIISSSRIRALVSEGQLELAAALLGRPFEMRGEVIHGEKRGRELGYPTANVEPDPICVIPPNGIYACFANSRPAVASLGVRPTFTSEGDLLLEVHLLDFAGDLYGQELKVDLIKRLRGELKFDGIEPLIAQMNLDAQEATNVCNSQSA